LTISELNKLYYILKGSEEWVNLEEYLFLVLLGLVELHYYIVFQKSKWQLINIKMIIELIYYLY
jgi:hypothetical protein